MRYTTSVNNTKESVENVWFLSDMEVLISYALAGLRYGDLTQLRLSPADA